MFKLTSNVSRHGHSDKRLPHPAETFPFRHLINSTITQHPSPGIDVPRQKKQSTQNQINPIFPHLASPLSYPRCPKRSSEHGLSQAVEHVVRATRNATRLSLNVGPVNDWGLRVEATERGCFGSGMMLFARSCSKVIGARSIGIHYSPVSAPGRLGADD